MNNLQTNLFSNFDINKDFDLMGNIGGNDTQNNLSSFNSDEMIKVMPFMNDQIRSNIKLGIEIYKQLNNINFDRYYIHSIINENNSK